MKTRVFPDPVENCGISDTGDALLQCGKLPDPQRKWPENAVSSASGHPKKSDVTEF